MSASTTPGAASTAAQEAFAALSRASEGRPYHVSWTKNGRILVHLDVADLQWASLFYQNGISKDYQIEVAVTDDRSFTKTQIIREFRWETGASPFGFVPKYTANKTVVHGSYVERSSQKVVVQTPDGLGTVGYSFDSREMMTFVDETLGAAGLIGVKSKAGKIGLIVAGSVIGALLIAGLIVLLVLLR